MLAVSAVSVGICGRHGRVQDTDVHAVCWDDCQGCDRQDVGQEDVAGELGEEKKKVVVVVDRIEREKMFIEKKYSNCGAVTQEDVAGEWEEMFFIGEGKQSGLLCG